MSALVRAIYSPAIIADAMTPITPALAIANQCRSAWARRLKWLKRDISCSLAQELDAMLPDRARIEAAHQALRFTLDTPLDPSHAEMFVALMLGAMGKKVAIDAEIKIWGLVDAISSDGTMQFLSNGPDFSPAVVVLAIRKILREQIFAPSPAEMRTQCIDVWIKINNLIDYLKRSLALRDQIEEQLSK
jgi:hypothetical protein